MRYVRGGAAVTADKYATFFTGTRAAYNEARETRWGGVVGGQASRSALRRTGPLHWNTIAYSWVPKA